MRELALSRALVAASWRKAPWMANRLRRRTRPIRRKAYLVARQNDGTLPAVPRLGRRANL